MNVGSSPSEIFDTPKTRFTARSDTQNTNFDSAERNCEAVTITVLMYQYNNRTSSTSFMREKERWRKQKKNKLFYVSSRY